MVTPKARAKHEPFVQQTGLRSLYTSLISVAGQKLECFKWAENNIFISIMKIKQTCNVVASCSILFQTGSLYVYTTIYVPMPCLWLHVIISQKLFKFYNHVGQSIVKQFTPRQYVFTINILHMRFEKISKHSSLYIAWKQWLKHAIMFTAVSYSNKCFTPLATGSNSIKLFWHNGHPQWQT